MDNNATVEKIEDDDEEVYPDDSISSFASVDSVDNNNSSRDIIDGDDSEIGSSKVHDE